MAMVTESSNPITNTNRQKRGTAMSQMLRGSVAAAIYFDRAHSTRGHNVSMTTRPMEPTEYAEPQALLLQLLDPAIRANPYPVCAQLREHGPLQLPEANFVLFSSYHDCDEVLRHPSSSSDRSKSTIARRQAQNAPAPDPKSHPDSCFSIHPITPDCASWSVRPSLRRW
ncbi:cytochrome P450 domain protein [Mycobacterium kansasii]|uniref:Cytochrome P450 domain protein n=1 Tax=Mycobacterium kansasii TaxID=1768 RepID=A0A1V3XA35_MYCKA|nr:cytochrome P450 domain protein [Mycobacterium kansasii]